MEFSPENKIVRICRQGMQMEEEGKYSEARDLYMRAWDEGTDDYEKFIASFYIARIHNCSPEKISWLQRATDLALLINDASVISAIPVLYKNIADCHTELGDSTNAAKYIRLSEDMDQNIIDQGPFYHGTRASLKPGDQLTAGNRSNYQEDLMMNHIYFTAIANGAGLAAALAKGDGQEHVYIVEPTGSFENDPNVTNKKFPGNPTRSYRTELPLKITGEIFDWKRISEEELKNWREKLAGSKGDIIN